MGLGKKKTYVFIVCNHVIRKSKFELIVFSGFGIFVHVLFYDLEYNNKKLTILQVLS